MLLVTGGFLVLFALVIHFFLASHLTLGAIEPAVLALGLVVVLLAVFPARGVRPEWFIGGCVSLWAVLMTVAIAELAFRGVGFDFRQQEAAWRRRPPYFRNRGRPQAKSTSATTGPRPGPAR